MTRFLLGNLALVMLSTLALGCGGNVVVGGGGSGGSGPGGDGGSTSTSTPTPTGGCDDHADCPDGLCIFSNGTCSTKCDEAAPCPAGQICDGCATSSCPGCEDCTAACVPANGKCDDHDDCASDSVCLYGAQKCEPKCNANGGCDEVDLVCNDCATSSCPFCNDCVGACTESF
jgi:hypothetical protein